MIPIICYKPLWDEPEDLVKKGEVEFPCDRNRLRTHKHMALYDSTGELRYVVRLKEYDFNKNVVKFSGYAELRGIPWPNASRNNKSYTSMPIDFRSLEWHTIAQEDRKNVAYYVNLLKEKYAEELGIDPSMVTVQLGLK